MCGIFGYKGKTGVENKLITGLKRLEYRGYDSAGLFVCNGQDGKLLKSTGKVANLSDKVESNIQDDDEYTMGIAHTRWATHGGVTKQNCHPHHDSNEKIYVVHNGIIENYLKLKKQLKSKGYEFYSDTDTEVIVKLIEDNWTGSLIESVEKVLPQLEGAYGLLVVDKDDPDKMVGVRYGSPLIFSQSEDEFFFSSDLQALAGFSNNVIFLEDGDLVYVDGDEYTIKSEGQLVEKPMKRLDIDSMEADKGNYEHFMLKEIEEQPNIVKRLFKGRIDFDSKELTASALEDISDLDISKVVFIACGTSYHAGHVGSYWVNRLTDMEASAHIASEFEYKNINVKDDYLYVFVSQSGETADTISALEQVKAQGGNTFGIVNVVGSSIAKQTDTGMFTRAGTEIGVASTKAFTAQITNIMILSLFLGKKSGNLNLAKYNKILKNLKQIPAKMKDILSKTDRIKDIVDQVKDYKHFMFLGRNYQLPIADESALKFKEITYRCCDSYSSGELKHGPLALIEDNVGAFVYAPDDLFLDMNTSSIQEINARDGKTIVISDKNIQQASMQIKIPSSINELYPYFNVLIGQLISYYMAKKLGKDIDKPRNLAKSVTVK